MYRLLRPLLFAMDAERSHDLVLGMMSRISASPALCRLTRSLTGRQVAAAPVRAMGLDFPNPVGLAAGLDKHAGAVRAFESLGFGFVELGTVTPEPQAGNPKPRMFRLRSRNALINRMGFNSVGLDRFLENLDRHRGRGPVGINIGKNASTPVEQAVEDYLAGLRRVYLHADYVTLNISSPNTANLRDLQQDRMLDDLLGTMQRERQVLADRHGRHVPLVLKIAPDIDQSRADAIAALVRRHGVDGIAATNTTTGRAGVEDHPLSEESGGLSGEVLLAQSNRVIRWLHHNLQDEIPVIGIGGISDGAGARAKFEAGATLVQLYTGLVYRGPGLVGEAVAGYLEHHASRQP